MTNKSESLTIRLSPGLLSDIEEAADNANMTVVDYVRAVLRKSSGQHGLEEIQENEEIVQRLEKIEVELAQRDRGLWEWLFHR